MAVDARRKVIDSCRRVVVKAGTRLLTDPETLPLLVEQIAAIRKTGRQVVLVSSGAVVVGAAVGSVETISELGTVEGRSGPSAPRQPANSSTTDSRESSTAVSFRSFITDASVCFFLL